jgi:KDO2-lipid IV(A) lauroyltransferase
MYLAYTIRALCILLSYLPLWFYRFLAQILSSIIIYTSSRAYRRIETNLLLTNLADDSTVINMAKQTVFDFSITIVEVFLLIWTKRKKKTIDKITTDYYSDNLLKRCANSTQPILFITPHLGNFELAVEYVTTNYKLDIQVLYKPVKSNVLNYLMCKGRENKYIRLCSVNNKKELLTAIRNFKNGQIIGMLPDSIASRNNGVWVNFFGQQVYASSLAGSLSLVPGTQVLLVHCIRNTKKYSLCVQKILPTGNDAQAVVQQIYNQIELLVQKSPTQYYWSYDRFRIPKYVR